MTGAVRRILFCTLIALAFSSCTRALYISDPYFDQFAGSSVGFYSIRKKLIPLKSGIRADFIEYADTPEFEEDLNGRLASGKYGAACFTPLSISKAEDLSRTPAFLMGGSSDIRLDGVGRILFSDNRALDQAGRELYRLYKAEDLKPLVIYYSSGSSAEEGRQSLLSSWPPEEQYLLLENWLDLDSSAPDIEKTIESFLSAYDLGAGEYIVLGYCAPVLRELMRSVDTETPMILSAPETELLPKGCRGVITPDYEGVLRAAANLMAHGSPGGSAAVENLYIKK